MSKESFNINIHEPVDEKSYVLRSAAYEQVRAKKEAHTRNTEKSFLAKLFIDKKDTTDLDVLHEEAIIENAAIETAKRNAEKNLPKARVVRRR